MRPVLKKALVSLLIAVGLFCVLAIWGEHWAKQWLEEKLAASGVVKYRQMHLSLLAGNIALEDVVIDWRWGEQDKRLHLISPKISVEGISWRNLYFNQKLKISDVFLQSPDMTMRDLPLQAATPVNISAKALPEVKILSLEIGNAVMESGCAEIYKFNPKGIEKAIVQAIAMDMALTDIKFDMQGDVMSAATFEDVEIRLQDVALDNENIDHRLHLDNFKLSKKDSLVAFTGFTLKQHSPPDAFFRKLAYKDAWFEMFLPSATIHGWRFDDILAGKMRADYIELDSFDMHVRTNQNLSPDPKDYKQMPQEMLRNSPIGILVDSLLVKQGRLRFESIGPGKTEAGVLTFYPIDASFFNVTNDSTRIAEQKTMEAAVVLNLQGNHPIYNHFWFDLASPDNLFSFKGNASNIPFETMNSFIKPCSNVYFEEGIINQISFSANADGKVANGSLSMDYEDLHFSMLNDERERRRILSRVVDLLFVSEDNDRSDEDFDKGVMHNVRNKQLSFFNYWWTTIQSGIRTSVIEEKRLKKVRNFMARRKERKAEKGR